MERFDLLNVPLQGVNLLEAGAGTGKTFTIEGLCLRLIMEKALPVSSILVVTYTVAATEELRDRIRRRLAVAVAAFATGESEDCLLQAMLLQHPDLRKRFLFQERLRTALRDFDEAAIFTIHSFCQRILQENAFESDSLFDTELITDERSLRAELVDDFWRRHFYETLPEVAGYALARGFSLDTLKKLLEKVIFHADLEIIPRIDPPSPQQIRAQVGAFSGALAGILAAWPEAREDVSRKLKSPALNAAVYGRRVEGLIKTMDIFVASGGGFPLFADFEKFTAPKLAEKTKKNQEPPVDDFFLLCRTVQERAAVLANDLDHYLLFLKREFVATAQKKLADRKGKDNVMFFDDLLIRLRGALQKGGGEELARIVGQKYRAALIDEFQDTDPVQFAIFRELFGRRAGRQEAEHSLFLIGDPKQAIYSFRGADIFAYMKAAAESDGKYTIVENWRSEPDLIRGVNSLFSGRENPFVYPEISFWPAEVPSGKVHDYFTLAGRREAPFRFWFMPAKKYGEAGRAISKEKAQPVIIRAVAGEIARLIRLSRQGQALIGERALQEDDIAVLVRKHREARLIQDALGRLKIPSVIRKTGNIFDTREAEELARIMRAVSVPGEERLVRAALLTDVLGVGINEIDRLATDEKGWGAWLEKFSYYHDLWFEAGFMGMFASLMAGEGIKLRLLAFPDGERRVTNLLQLSELLHRRSEAQQAGVMSLWKWFEEQRNPETPRLDEHQLRLESDARAVRIVTIHQSKGLEYPVVFCPFTWEGSEVMGDAISFHGRPGEGAGEGNVICDLGSAAFAAHRARAAREMLAENVRLLYVALTRARHRCYIVWGRFNKSETSAPAYLFHGGEGEIAAGREDDTVAVLADSFGKLDDEAMQRQLAKIALAAEGTIALEELPADFGEILPPPQEKGDTLTCRAFSGKIDRFWRVASFSSLVSGTHQGEEQRDYDGSSDPGALWSGAAIDRSSPGEEGGRDIFSFPRGARAGTLIHEILRYLDFQDPDGEGASLLVSRKLSAYGFPPFWEGTIISMLRKVVSLPLRLFSATGASEKPFTLASLGMRDRLNELEFYFPLRRLAPEDLQDILGGKTVPLSAQGEAADHNRQNFSLATRRLHFSPVRGFMKGFMDLAFCWGGKYYLVDWKSNHLGNQVADYGQRAVARVMRDNFYFLQYHLYCLALHLYLGARLPGYRYDRHFGGVYYFFIRGVDPALGQEGGIYRDRPPEGLIKDLATKLIARI